MAAVVDRAAGLRWVVDGAEILPFACAHLGAGRGAAGRVVCEKGDEQAVGLGHEKSAELVEPEALVCGCAGVAFVEKRWVGKNQSGLFRDWVFRLCLRVEGVAGVEGFDVFLQLERRIDL